MSKGAGRGQGGSGDLISRYAHNPCNAYTPSYILRCLHCSPTCYVPVTFHVPARGKPQTVRKRRCRCSSLQSTRTLYSLEKTLYGMTINTQYDVSYPSPIVVYYDLLCFFPDVGVEVSIFGEGLRPFVGFLMMRINRVLGCIAGPPLRFSSA